MPYDPSVPNFPFDPGVDQSGIAEILQAQVAQPARAPAGEVKTIVRSEIPDVLDIDYLGSLVSSSEMTEKMIDTELQAHWRAMLAQDDLLETDDGKLVGLRVSTVPRLARPEN